MGFFASIGIEHQGTILGDNPIEQTDVGQFCDENFGTLPAAMCEWFIVTKVGERRLHPAIRLAPTPFWKEYEMPRIVFGLSLFICDTATTLLTLLNGWGALAIVAISLLSSIATLVVSSSLGNLIWPTYFWDSPTTRSKHPTS